MKYAITKKFTVEMAHILDFAYSKGCMNLHGHSATIELVLESDRLNEGSGMVMDFKFVKELFQPIYNDLDHKCIVSQRGVDFLFPRFNTQELQERGIVVVPFNPSAENLSKWIFNRFTAILEDEVDKSRAYVEEKPVVQLKKVIYWETATGKCEYTKTW